MLALCAEQVDLLPSCFVLFVKKNDNNDNNDNKKNNTRFKKPSIEEISLHCKERKNGINAEVFYNYYEARGWQFKNGQPMKDWKATIRTWEGKEFNKTLKETENVIPEWVNANPVSRTPETYTGEITQDEYDELIARLEAS